MPITLNNSNISVQYNTGSNYIIETVKSDLYLRNEIYDTIVSNNLQTAPVTPIIYIENSSGNVYAIESYTYTGTANTADYARVFSKNTTCDILVVGGGGGGGYFGGGGGGGAILFANNITLGAGSYTIKVGKGGTGVSTTSQNGTNGIDSSITINSVEYIAKGGGGGGSRQPNPYVGRNGSAGGSGGGGSQSNTTSEAVGGASNKNTYSGWLSYGNSGGKGRFGTTGSSPTHAGGGGGGAGSVGNDFSNSTGGGNGGSGMSFISTFGTSVGHNGWFGGGGGGFTYINAGNPGYGNGGNGLLGGGGNGGYDGTPDISALDGLPNTGGGGGGSKLDGGTAEDNDGGDGGSGIVIIRYLLGSDPSINLLTAEPTVSPNIRSDEVIETYLYTTGTSTTNYTKVFSHDTLCDILIVGGGGAGGNSMGGGGGAGGVVYTINQTLVAGTYTIGVGKGGLGLALTGSGQGTIGANQDGKDSFIQLNNTDVSLPMGGVSQSLRGKGGGGGGIYFNTLYVNGRNGGSGGGCSETDTNGYAINIAGSATQGNTFWNGSSYVAGGKAGRQNTRSGSDYNAGGGGGAGNNGSSYKNGNNGVQINITGTTQFYAAGGGGGQYDTQNSINEGIGGSGIGGNGRIRVVGSYLREATSGTNGTGSGGGGGAYTQDPDLPAGSGGSGIVIIRYRSLAPAPNIINMNKTLTFNYYPSLSPTIYTLTFPTKTIATINNSGDKILDGSYTITLGNTLSTIVPTQNQNFQDKTHFSPTISIRYNLLNPVLDPIGAQWTYNTSNTNVYHMGSVGIGTKSPEYSPLDVRGAIYSSLGGYTQTGLTTWSIASDRRIKENIVKASYEKCLDNVKNIELYNFNFKDDCVNTNDKHQLGFIAQEVQQIYPKAVEVGKMILNTNETIDDLLSLNTTQIDYTLYGAVKNLIEKIEDIDNELGNIERNI
jgi:hypothetical protein